MLYINVPKLKTSTKKEEERNETSLATQNNRPVECVVYTRNAGLHALNKQTKTKKATSLADNESCRSHLVQSNERPATGYKVFGL